MKASDKALLASYGRSMLAAVVALAPQATQTQRTISSCDRRGLPHSIALHQP
jgi:hypothetical protein